MSAQPSRLSQWWTSRSDRSASELSGVLLSEPEMRERIDREKAKCDRHRHGFCLIVFDLTGPRWSAEQTKVLACALAGRLRRSDDAGWLTEGKLVVLLPHASLAGAWSVSADVYRALPANGTSPPSHAAGICSTIPSMMLASSRAANSSSTSASLLASGSST